MVDLWNLYKQIVVLLFISMFLFGFWIFNILLLISSNIYYTIHLSLIQTFAFEYVLKWMFKLHHNIKTCKKIYIDDFVFRQVVSADSTTAVIKYFNMGF